MKATNETVPHSVETNEGWRMPANAVKVDRSTKWGNPFKVDYKGMTPELACRASKMFWPNSGSTRYPRVLKLQSTISSKNCAQKLSLLVQMSEVCHADVLLEIANG